VSLCTILTKQKRKPFNAVAPTYLAMYERCPRQFRYARLDGEEDRSVETEPQVFGNFVHYAMDFYLGQRMEVHAAFLRAYQERMIVEHTAALVGRVLAKARKAFEWTAAQMYRAITKEPNTIYIPEFYYTGQGLEGEPISGRIDLLVFFPSTRSFHVYDYKGGRRIPDADQLVFYKWGVQHYWPSAKQVGASFVWFWKEYIKTVRFTESLERHVSERIKKMLAGVAAEQFPTDKGTHCRWCGFRHLCPEFGGRDDG